MAHRIIVKPHSQPRKIIFAWLHLGAGISQYRFYLNALSLSDNKNFGLTGSLAKLEKEKRDLMTQITGSPHVDYQVVMEYHEKKAAFRDADQAFYAAYEVVAPFTMTSIERLYALYKGVEYLVKSNIPGDIVECGVWRGGSMMLAALVLRNLGDTQRRLWLYDTFEGSPKPDPEKDIDMWGNSQFSEWVKYSRTEESSALADVSVEEVRRNVASTGYPLDKVVLLKGMVQRTIPAHAPQEIALLRLDTDWHDSTVCELRNLYPRVVDGGVLIVDDYGHLLGQRQAVDEYFAASDPFPLMHRIDYSGRLIVKQSHNSHVATCRGSRSSGSCVRASLGAENRAAGQCWRHGTLKPGFPS